MAKILTETLAGADKIKLDQVNLSIKLYAVFIFTELALKDGYFTPTGADLLWVDPSDILDWDGFFLLRFFFLFLFFLHDHWHLNDLHRVSFLLPVIDKLVDLLIQRLWLNDSLLSNSSIVLMVRTDTPLTIAGLSVDLWHLFALKGSHAIRSDKTSHHHELAFARANPLTLLGFSSCFQNYLLYNTIGSGPCTHIVCICLLDNRTKYKGKNSQASIYLHYFKNIFIKI